MALDPALPFALLWDSARRAGRLFTGPVETLDSTDIEVALDRLRAWTTAGDWAVGALSYEAGHALEPRLRGCARGPSWARFTRHEGCTLIDEAGVADLLQPFAGPVIVGDAEPLVTREAWLAAVGQVQALIGAGDLYQANLTFPARVRFAGHPLALFRRLFRASAAPHGGVVHLGGGRWWLSLSPELFFAAEDGVLTARPMKGTAARRVDMAQDRAAAECLATDPKNQAENLMITDLIRNDLARVAEPGSVRVPALFEVESYPSVHQLTSTVTARTRNGVDAVEVLRALHPCGSITGAPKIRAMEVIADVEGAARGLYTGSLGWIGPGANTARFAVAIRTLDVVGREARLGLGAGIVADSQAEAEWDECLAKARFLKPGGPRTLIETLRQEPAGSVRLALHLDRMERSAARFGFAFDRARLEVRLAGLRVAEARRLRLLLGAEGSVALQLSPLPPPAAGPVEVALVPLPVAPDDWRLAHKSGDRDFYDEARRTSGAFECLFVRADGRLTEGSFTNLFVERDGRLLTPPLADGLLPGVLRAELLAAGTAVEAELRPADLRHRFLLGNSLRGLFAARLAARGGQFYPAR